MNRYVREIFNRNYVIKSVSGNPNLQDINFQLLTRFLATGARREAVDANILSYWSDVREGSVSEKKRTRFNDGLLPTDDGLQMHGKSVILDKLQAKKIYSNAQETIDDRGHTDDTVRSP